MTDYNTLQRKRNIVVGGFVLIAVAALLWMVAIFGELPVAASKFRSFNVIAMFPSAYGIQEKTPVYYLGYPIGKVILVQSPQLTEGPLGKEHQILVSLAIEKKYKTIPENIEIKVMKRSMGSSFVELFDPEVPAKTFLREGLDRIQGSVGSTNEFIPEKVQKKLETLVVKISSLAASIDTIVGDEENQQNIKETLANFSNVSEQASVTLKSITNFTDAGSNILTTTSENLNDTIVQINSLINKINEGSGTASRIINDGRLYENLLESSEELKMALEQLKILAAEAREKGIKIKL